MPLEQLVPIVQLGSAQNETVTPNLDAAPATPPSSHGGLTLAASFLHRWILAYWFIYIFPFPLGTIPFTDAIITPWSKFWHWLVPLTGRGLFGVKITIFPGGSGDTTYNYVEFFAFAVLSLVAAIVWTVLARGRLVGLRTRELFAAYVRYNLATIMLSYGWHKVIPMQLSRS